MTRTALVTGASTGIGEACARRLDAMGWRVFAGVRREADAEALRRGASPRLVPVRLDVTDAAQVGAAAGAVAAAVGDAGLDALVNNAGIVVAGPLECLPLAEVRAQLEVNVVGVVAVTQACLPLLRRARGRIVNIGSISGRSAAPFIGAYSASKFALEALTDALRVELAPWGIEVAVIEPGAIATPIWAKSEALAERNLAAAGPGAGALYGAAMAAMRRVVGDAARRAAPADRVADAVAHALTARRPRTRYLVGADARLQAALARLLPDRLRDRLTARFMGLPRKSVARV
jgi:NAD(P)-dependent dehydrogenase (short-subunit alcohol dehydrogenase family)